MRLLYLATSPDAARGNASGMGRHVAGMIDAFSRTGHDVRAVLGGELAAVPSASFPQGRPGGGSALRRLGRAVTPPLLWRTLADVRTLAWNRRMGRLVRDVAAAHAPQLVYERQGHLQDAGHRWARTRPVPWVLEVNAPAAEERAGMVGASLLDGVADRVFRESLRDATLVVTVSTALARRLGDLGVPAARLLVLPNAVTPHEVPPPRPGPPTVGMAGSFLPWHGTGFLLDAFARVHQDLPTARLLLVGDGPCVPAVRQQARRLGLEGSVEWTGRVPPEDVDAHLARVHVGVMPRSNWYGSPMKIFEYGLHGVPVVSVDVAPVAEVLSPGEHGLLFPDGDVGAFAAALSTLLTDEPRRRRLGAAWRARVLGEHTWVRNVERLAERLRALGAWEAT